MYIYKRTEPQLWTAGYYTPDGKFEAESDWGSSEEAAKRVHYLNGGKDNTYKCVMCTYESDMKNHDKWEGMCYQCWAGKRELGMEY